VAAGVCFGSWCGPRSVRRNWCNWHCRPRPRQLRAKVASRHGEHAGVGEPTGQDVPQAAVGSSHRVLFRRVELVVFLQNHVITAQLPLRQPMQSSSGSHTNLLVPPIAVNEFLAPHRRRCSDFARDADYVRGVLRDGNRRTNEEATHTLDDVHAAMGTV
jgi:hypothetical protein